MASIQNRTPIDTFLNDLDPDECEVLIRLVARLDPYEMYLTSAKPVYLDEEQVLITKFQECKKRLSGRE